MTILMRMTWAGVTPEQYDEVRRRVNWVQDVAIGGGIHLAAFDDAGVLHCADVWDSPQDLEVFLRDRITPAVEALGITTEPEIFVDQLHEEFIAKAGTIRIPEQQRLVAATTPL